MARRTTIQYRCLKTEGLPAGLILKRALIDALRTPCGGKVRGDSARHRIIDIDQDGSFVILNQTSLPSTWDGPVFGGQIIHLQPGSDVHAVTQSLDEDAPHFLIQRLNIGNDARVAKGVLYFAIVGNHVGLIESSGVKGRTLERYLTAFLAQADAIEAGQTITLLASIQATDGTRLPSSTEITVAAVPSRPGATSGEIAQEAGRDRGFGATVLNVLRALGWADDAVRRLEADIPADGRLEGEFRIYIKTGNRRGPISRGTIDEALRNVDLNDMKLRGDGVERGGLVKLSKEALIKANGELLDPGHAMQEIVAALKLWADQGRIDCDFSA